MAIAMWCWRDLLTFRHKDIPMDKYKKNSVCANAKAPKSSYWVHCGAFYINIYVLSPPYNLNLGNACMERLRRVREPPFDWLQFFEKVRRGVLFTLFTRNAFDWNLARLAHQAGTWMKAGDPSHRTCLMSLRKPPAIWAMTDWLHALSRAIFIDSPV